jgi:hypothetical protein
MSVIKRLTEGIVKRDLEKEGGALMSKWSDTGLLEGITDERAKASMARLLENQAAELLREANTMSGGDVEGFAAVAFPIVRRVFGSLIANELVSVQPMSLPSGLIFFLDFTFERDRLGAVAGQSLFGGGVIGSQLTGGVSLSGPNAENSLRALNNGYSLPTGSSGSFSLTVLVSGTVGGNTALDKLVRFDPDLASGSSVVVSELTVSSTLLNRLDRVNLIAISVSGTNGQRDVQVRRLTQFSGSDKNKVLVVFNSDLSPAALATKVTGTEVTVRWPLQDDLTNASLGAVVPVASQLGAGSSITLEGEANIPEIDIKVDSVSVTAKSRKLKAKWTPELGQDLNAYHNLDAEVELTSILSEQIGLEIDQEMLGELVRGATAATLYWSRRPGKFVERSTGQPILMEPTLHACSSLRWSVPLPEPWPPPAA